jgi:hypothetical protein
MRAAVNVFVLWGLTSVLLGAPAFAEGSGQEGADRFVPSLSINSGLLVQEWSGTVASEICRECSFPDPSQELLRQPDEGSDRDTTPYVGFALELMSPELPVPGAPRLFVGGEFAAAFGIERRLAREGSPGIIGSPLPAAERIQFDEDIATGQGGETIAQMDHFIYGAQAGFALPVEFLGRALRVKPSFGWIRYGVDLEGIVTDAECATVNPGQFNERNECNVNNGGFLRAVALESDASEEFDAIGPGLDLEMDTGRFGPIGTSLFAGARFYRVLGDRTVEFQSQDLVVSDQLGTDTYRSRYSFEIDEWFYRIGIGMRFQWLGSAD